MTASNLPANIMFDMDGVLADFVASCRRLFWHHHPTNHHLTKKITSYNFWVDDWRIPDGDQLISSYVYEVFAQAPPIEPLVFFAQTLDRDRFRPEIVTHLWGGEDKTLQNLSLAGKRYWLTTNGLGGIPVKAVRGVNPIKRGSYDVVIEDRPDVLLSGDLGHGRTLRILLASGWQQRPKPDLAKQNNLVVLKPAQYDLVESVVSAYLDYGWPTTAIQRRLVDYPRC